MTDDWSGWHRLSPFGGKIGPTTNGVHIGALVSIAENASLWDGSRCEGWYQRKKWYVTGLNGNKAVLGKDDSGKYQMRTPISTNFLTVIEPSNDYNGGENNGQI